MRRFLVALVALTSLAFWAEHAAPPLIRYAMAQSGTSCAATPLTRTQLLNSFADVPAPGTPLVLASDLRNFVCAVLDGSNAFSGNNSHSGSETFTGALIEQPTDVSSLPYTVAAADSTLCISASAAGTVNLPASPINGRFVKLKDCNHNFSTNNVSVKTTDGTTIDSVVGATGVVLNVTDQGQGFQFDSHGSRWMLW